MAPSTDYVLLRMIYGAFFPFPLPFLFLTSFSFALTLLAVLVLLLPAFISAVFISLHHLWCSLLSWVTAPFLFVLLNGIIVVLTATSGMFTSSVMSEEDADFDSAHLLETVEDVRRFQLPVPVKARTVMGMSSQESSGAHDGRKEAEEHWFLVKKENDEEEYADAEEEGEEMEEETKASKFLTVSLYSLARTRVLCLPEAEYVDHVVGGSEPSSPQFMTPLKTSSIKRALSIDSASFHGNQPVPSMEQLSDDAFKKRVEDFICRMNAQIRSEAK